MLEQRAFMPDIDPTAALSSGFELTPAGSDGVALSPSLSILSEVVNFGNLVSRPLVNEALADKPSYGGTCDASVCGSCQGCPPPY